MKFINHINSKLSIDECDAPVVGEHDILIKVAASGVNRADIYQAQGNYPAPDGASDILGLEVSGEIVEIGESVRAHAVGDKVCALLQGGGYAEYVVVQEHRALPIPHGMDLIEAAGILENFATAYINLFDIAKMKPNDKVLIHGGASGVGSAAIGLASEIGAEVFTTVGSDKKAEICKSLGASHVINYKTQDFVAQIKQITDGQGVNIVLDMVGGDYIEKNMKALAYKGVLVSIAFIKSAKVDVNFAPLLMKNLTITGSTLRDKDALTIHELLQSLRVVVWPMFESGEVKLLIDSILPWQKVGEAHKRMENFEHAGKIILTP